MKQCIRCKLVGDSWPAFSQQRTFERKDGKYYCAFHGAQEAYYQCRDLERNLKRLSRKVGKVRGERATTQVTWTIERFLAGLKPQQAFLVGAGWMAVLVFVLFAFV